MKYLNWQSSRHFFVLLAVGLMGCAASSGGSPNLKADEVPAWAKSGIHPGYSQGMYWTGVGSGADLKTASDQARAEVAAQLKIQIKNSTETTESEYTGSDREYYASAFKSTTESIVDQTIQGIEIVESKPVKGTYYAYAVLDRNQYLGALEAELREYGDRLAGLYDDAEGLLDEGKVFPAIENFSDALELVPQVYPRQSFYNALAKVKYNLPNNLNGPGLISEVRKVLSAINLTIESGENQTAAPGQRLGKDVVAKVVLNRNGKFVAISGMPLRAVYESGDLVGKPSTDANGLASISVSAVPGNRADAGSVTISPNLGKMPDIMAPQLKHLSATVAYGIAGNVPSFAIIVQDANGNRVRAIEDDLAQAVIKAGFKVDASSKMKIEGKVKLDDVREINLGGRSNYQAEATLNLTVTDLSSGVQKASMSVSKKTVNTSKSKASDSALNDLGGSVKRRALTEMLGDALGE